MTLRTLGVLGLLAVGAAMASSCAAGGSSPICGDGICDPQSENSLNCATDCSSTCGNWICDIGENAESCASDCTGAICGNAICESSENNITCMVDCICGNNTCDTGESDATCPVDCAGGAVCGDGACNGTETSATCPADCTTNPVCGDGVCNGTETTASCPADCTTNPVCGNNICETGEDVSCPTDCTATCSDPVCDLYPQCGCTGGQKCSLDANNDNDCINAGSTQAGGSCTADTDCAGGTICLARDNDGTVGQCMAYCDDTTQANCTGTTSHCYELVDGDLVPIDGAAICTITCLPENPTVGCPVGFSCSIYGHSSTPDSFSDCHADVGTGTFGSACDATTGPYCAAGYGCFDDGTSFTCYQWCTATSSCSGGTTCDTAAFTTPPTLNGTIYGICY